jgi:acyl carrier protein
MSLDTVELIYSIERYFSIDIPDPVCETLYTVGDVAGYISQRLGVVGMRQSAAREAAQQQLSALLELPPDAFDEGNTITIGQLLPDAAAVARFRQQAISCGLELPELSEKRRVGSDGPSFFEKLLGLTPPPPPVPWPDQPLAALVDWTVAANYEQLPMPFASEYEVERAMMGITSDKSGVPVEEILLASSFTDDLGMD